MDYKCPRCPEAFSSAPELSKHIGEHKDEPIGLSAHYKVALKAEADKVKRFDCSKCSSRFDTKQALTEHSKKHKKRVNKNEGKDKKFRCDKCGQTFRQRINLQRHQSSTHGSRETASMCSECGKICYDKYALAQHMVSHRTDKNYQCNTCGKMFKGSQHLRHHERLHAAVKPHQCSQCGKGFYQVSALKRHERTHSGEKPYVCATCGRGFGDSTSYKNHQFTHDAVKPYACNTCGKTFIKKSRYTQHLEGQKCPVKAVPDKQQTEENNHNQIAAQYNIYPQQPLETPIVQMVAQPVPTAQQQQPHCVGDLRNASIANAGEFVWQYEGVRGDHRIMVQPMRTGQGGMMWSSY